MDQWLVRTAKNLIQGPYSRAELCELIRSARLGLEDEVCQANHYWIYLHEKEEVVAQLGIQVPPSSILLEEEITETETDTEIDQTDPHFRPSVGSKSGREEDHYRPRILGSFERTSVWEGLAWFLILIACFLVLSVLWLLSRH